MFRDSLTAARRQRAIVENLGSNPVDKIIA
jgi:hypothetical protein